MHSRANPYSNFPVFMEGEGIQSGGTTPPGDQNASWYAKAGVAPEHHEWLAGKEFADPTTAIASYRALEGMVGRNRIAIPNGPDDKDAFNQIYRTLGRPDKAADYKLPETVKIKPDEWNHFSTLLYDAGLSQKQVETVVGGYHARGLALQTAADNERTAAEIREKTALDAEWASNAQANKDLASRAYRVLGINQETSDKLESVLGYGATMKLFHKIGAGLSESAFHQDETKRGELAGQTVDSMRKKIDDRMRDPEFKKTYNNSDPRIRKGAIDEMEGLQKELATLMQAQQARAGNAAA